jgi:hypothetical protein
MIISLNNINWLAFAVEINCVFHEVRTESLIIFMKFRIQNVNTIVISSLDS